MIRKFLLASATFLALAGSSHATTNVLPLVPDPTWGYPSQLLLGEVLWNGTNPFGLMSGSFTLNDCLKSGGGAIIVDEGAACDSGGGGGSWLPLVDGSEPPNLLSDGNGNLITVAYTP